MEPEQKPPETANNNPTPNIIKPNIPSTENAGPSFQQVPPQPNLPPQPAPIPTDKQPPVNQSPSMPLGTSQLFQPDSKLPEFGGAIIDNQPPKGIKRIFKNKKITFLLLAQFLAVIFVIGGIFGYYLPNRPENVWKTGLNRSGEALDKLLIQATEKNQLEAFKKSEINASLAIKAQGADFKGSFTGRFDQSKADGSLNFEVNQGGNNAKLAMKYISILAGGATYPDFYAQFSGIKELGGDAFVPGISKYDGKWIAVNSDYFKSLGLPVTTPGQVNKSQINAGDVSELIRAVSSVSKDYLLTSNMDRAVIKQVKFVGKEKTDGISAYHYIAGIDKAHAKDYCKALYEKISTTTIYKNFNGNDQDKINNAKNADTKACQDDDTNINTNFDLWIDAKYKLIHKIRIPDESNKQAYTDIGQTYKGGDDVSLFVAYHNGKEPMDAKLTFSTNIKSVDSKGEFSIKGGKGSEAYDGKATFEIKPLSEDLNIQKPANSIPLQDILKKYGYDPTSYLLNNGLSGSPDQAKDADRKSDINAIDSQVEVYFAQNGYYPTLSEINNPSWRSANLRGFTNDSLAPPGSSSTSLSSTASSSQYGYSTSGCSVEGCLGFVLTALLSNGQKYIKTGSNN